MSTRHTAQLAVLGAVAALAVGCNATPINLPVGQDAGGADTITNVYDSGASDAPPLGDAYDHGDLGPGNGDARGDLLDGGEMLDGGGDLLDGGEMLDGGGDLLDDSGGDLPSGDATGDIGDDLPLGDSVSEAAADAGDDDAAVDAGGEGGR